VITANLPAITPSQVTPEGTEIFTVARDGSRMAKCTSKISVPIFVTAIYRAERRQSDGILTWRRVGSYRDSTAGHTPTGPMVARAKSRAAERGCEYVAGIRHGKRCK
jgi:hypothetical protein